MGCRINGPMLNLGTGGILPEEVVAFPVRRRPDWSGNEATPAVRAHVLQNSIDTGGAKGAFVGTDACFDRVRRQRPVAVLAGRPELKHTGSFRVAANVRVERPPRSDATREPQAVRLRRSGRTRGWASLARASTPTEDHATCSTEKHQQISGYGESEVADALFMNESLGHRDLKPEGNSAGDEPEGDGEPRNDEPPPEGR